MRAHYLPAIFLLLPLLQGKASSEIFAEGLSALHLLTYSRGIEVSRHFFHLARPGEANSLWWGRMVEGDEAGVSLDENEPRVAFEKAKKSPAAHMRWCNFHVHRKTAILRQQRERNEPAPHGNLSFPPSGADVQLSLIGEETWAEEGITGESAMGVLDSLGLWMYRELGDDFDPRRIALYRKHNFTPSEIAATKSAGGNAADTLRYEYMKYVNSTPKRPEEISKLPEYRLLVLRYAVLENIEIAFLTIPQAVGAGPCRGF